MQVKLSESRMVAGDKFVFKNDVYIFCNQYNNTAIIGLLKNSKLAFRVKDSTIHNLFQEEVVDTIQ